MQLLTFDDYLEPAQRLAAALGIGCERIASHRFPDQEVRITVPTVRAPHIILCRSLHLPDPKLIELLIAAQTLRDLGAQRLTLVSPYLCYMRQDAVFHPGEAVSQRIIGRFLADLFDDVITVDPHLHRVSTLAEAVPARTSVALSATAPFTRFLAERFSNALLVGPDSESVQWVSTIAQRTGFSYAVGSKRRLDDRSVVVTLPDQDWQQYDDIVVIDDVASSGRTLEQTARVLKQLGARRIHCLLTHALFAGDALDHLTQSGYVNIWSTDSIPHPSNVVPLADLLATALSNLAGSP